MAEASAIMVRCCTIRAHGPDAAAVSAGMASYLRSLPKRSGKRYTAKPGPKHGCRLWTREDWAPFVGRDRTISEIADAAGELYHAAYDAVRRLKLPHREGAPGGTGRAHDETIRGMALRGRTTGEMARRTGMKAQSCGAAIRRIGLLDAWRAAKAARKAREGDDA